MRNRPRESMRLPLLAGWLFADLMLLLFVIGLSFAPVQSAVVNGKPTATPTPTPTLTPAPTPTPTQRVLNRTYYTVYVNVPLPELSPGSSAAARLIHGADAKISQLARAHPELAGKDVAVAVIFGAAPLGNINAAISEAKTAGNILRAKDATFGQASFLPEWTSGASNFVEMILFFYAS